MNHDGHTIVFTGTFSARGVDQDGNRILATFNGHTTLVNGERVQFVLNPTSATGHAFSIRKQFIRRFDLDDYERAGAFRFTKVTGDDYIDWDRWLGWKFGLAPKIPWNPEHYFRFRKFWPYSGGQASDLLYHTLAPLLLAIAGPNGAFPRRVTASGGLYTFKENRDVPDTYVTTLDYADEFTILLDGVGSIEVAQEIAARAPSALSEPVRFEGREVVATASVGIAVNHPGSRAGELLRNADIAMYNAKRKGIAR